MKGFLKYKYCFLGSVLILLDLISKYYAHLYAVTEQKITSFLSFELVRNFGITFGLFGEYGKYANIFFSVVAIFIISTLFAVLHERSKKRQDVFGEILVVVGGVGNAIDRLLNNHVTDFIYVHYGEWSFPYYFNIADIYIVLGVSYIVARLLLVDEN